MLTLKEFENELYQIDKSDLGCILGGAESTPGGSKTVGVGTPHETSFEYSEDTVNGDLTTYHQCENGTDRFCGYA